MSNFRVGQKVVCVDDSGLTSVVKGAIYTIIGLSDFKDFFGNFGVELLEKQPITHDRYFVKNRFRPVITPEQDIALFHALCPGLSCRSTSYSEA